MPIGKKKSAQVTAYERVTLYGLTVMPKRRVHYGPINSNEAREIFIRGALVAGDFITRASFFEYNRQLVREVEELEHKTRRQDVLVDEQEIYAFYDLRIPEQIHNGASFDKWRRRAEQKEPQLLYLTREYLMRHAAGCVTEEQFPESMQLDRENFLPLHYRFEPGHILDGVTVTIPLSHLNRLNKAPFDHLVPGLIREKITWYFRALPKQTRRHLVPLPESVTQFLESLEPGDQSIILTDLLAKFVHRKVGAPISSNVWEDKEPPLYLQMNYKVVDDAGYELAMSRDLAQLQSQLGQAARLTFAKVDDEEKNSIERENVMRWDFGDLPEEITFARMGKQLTGYPALVDQQACVAIRLFDTRQAAEKNMRAGVRRLLRFELKDRMKQLEKSLPGLKQAVLQLTTLIHPDELKQDMLTAISDRAFIGGDTLPHNEKDFTAQKQRARTRLPAVTEALAQITQKIGCEVQALLQRLSASGIGNERLRKELNMQLRHLLFPGFLSVTPWDRLQHYPRYLKGMHMRLEKFSNNPQRDGQHSATLTSLWNQYEQRMEKHRQVGNHDSNLVEYRWQIEELRISLFAQELKTPAPVSVKRLQKLWEKVTE